MPRENTSQLGQFRPSLAQAQPFGVEFGSPPRVPASLAGWVRHWVERKYWFDACQ
jgi:hypothetical protein